jgi:hypothetical protein
MAADRTVLASPSMHPEKISHFDVELFAQSPTDGCQTAVGLSLKYNLLLNLSQGQKLQSATGFTSKLWCDVGTSEFMIQAVESRVSDQSDTIRF